mmetsp:Transcript_63295/g.72554  ORF Transcript_63295/g.72554 Transcript_63295/m.72554 type:complete len:203 (-) Transcript_63295:106-714(-)
MNELRKETTEEVAERSLRSLGRLHSWVEEREDRNKSDIRIIGWLDYSSKYGMGYLLSNGVTGIHFNTTETIVIEADNEHVHASDYHNKDILTRHQTGDLFHFSGHWVPLVKHFRDYLRKATGWNDAENNDIPDVIHVQRWMKKDENYFFFLNNGTIQVCFPDCAQLIIDANSFELKSPNDEVRIKERLAECKKLLLEDQLRN